MSSRKSLGIFLLAFVTLVPSLSFAASASQLQAMRDNSVRAATQMMMFVALDKAGERRQAALKAGLPRSAEATTFSIITEIGSKRTPSSINSFSEKRSPAPS